MHIVIPMSGTGERFKKAGYDRPKPLIVVDGEPIIKHVVSMFSAQDKFTFICNRDHIENTDIADVLEKIAPAGEIVTIDPHKFGPVYAVQKCFDHIGDDEEVIVNYCDFYSYWNYQDFLAQTRSRGAAGAIAAYHGFHPHMLGTDNYAFIKESDQWMEAIQEKKPFTDNRMAEFASNGTYYFARGKWVKKYFQDLIDRQESINGEYYVSMVYNLLVEDKLPVFIYEVQHMLQWGTPRDLEEYQHWSDYFANLVGADTYQTHVTPADLCLIPMAGQGARFTAAGYDMPKPLIAVSGKPMVVQACNSLPAAKRYVFVAQKEHLANSNLENIIRHHFENVSVVALDGLTEGQAISCQAGLLGAAPPVDQGASLLIGACDNGMIFDHDNWNALMADTSIDVAAFSFRHHPASERNPQMYGWLKVENPSDRFPTVTDVSVKKAISDQPANDHAVVGAFFFRKVSYFLEALQVLQDENIRVNGEFYVDSMIGIAARLGRKCVVFEVDDYICFGTPNELRTFEYWQSFFHKCSWHRYTIERDPQANENDRELSQRVKQEAVRQ